jgi:uncharacterized protein YukE
MAGSGAGYEVHYPALHQHASLITAQAQQLEQVHATLAGVQVPAGAFGKLPESADLHSAYQAHAQAEVTNTSQLPDLLTQVGGALDGTADHYTAAEVSNLEAILSVAPSGSGGGGGGGGGKGVGDYAVEAYQWATTPLVNWPVHLPDIHQMESGAIDGAIDSAVRGILEAVGLMALLEKVTGDPGALHAAGQTWLDQAKATGNATSTLRDGAKTLPDQWKGEASAAFGTFMGKVVTSTDSMASDMATTAQILNNAGQECQLAQDLVIMIIREAAEWAAVTMAATALADIFTLGLATIAGGIAESAEMATFVARATEVSVKLGKALEALLNQLKELKGAAEAVRDAEGISSKLSKFRDAQKDIKDIRKSGSILKAGDALKNGDPNYLWQRGFSRGWGAARGGAGAGLSGITGLPGGVGVMGLPGDIAHGGSDTITDGQNLPGDAQILNGVTHTGPGTPAPYHVSAGEILKRTTTISKPPPE